MRRREKQITDTKQMEQILAQAQVCRLAMVDKGHPYVVPLNFGYRDGALYFHSALEGRGHGSSAHLTGRKKREPGYHHGPLFGPII